MFGAPFGAAFHLRWWQLPMNLQHQPAGDITSNVITIRVTLAVCHGTEITHRQHEFRITEIHWSLWGMILLQPLIMGASILCTRHSILLFWFWMLGPHCSVHQPRPQIGNLFCSEDPAWLDSMGSQLWLSLAYKFSQLLSYNLLVGVWLVPKSYCFLSR